MTSDRRFPSPPIVVDVIGTPAPQGSKSYKGRGRSGRPILVESSAAVKPWRATVAWQVAHTMRQAGWRRADGPVAVEVEFYLHRPPSAPKSRTRPDVKPDLDKLLRSTLDALTESGAIADDARVVEVVASKHYAGDWTGARITIRTLEGATTQCPK